MAGPEDLSTDELAAFQRQVEARLAELLAVAPQNDARREDVTLDQTRVGRLSRMDALQMQAMAQATERRRQQEVQRLEAALKRLETEEFGYCKMCGELIARKRLESDPSVSTCIKCASGSR